VLKGDPHVTFAAAGFLFYPVIAGATAMRLSSLFGLGLLAVSCTAKSESPAAAAPAPLSAAELDSVKSVDAAFAAGMNAMDSAAVFAVYAADAKLMPPDSPTLDGAAVHSVIAGLIAAGASDFVLTPTTTYGVGDLAYMVGTASFKVGGASETVKYTEVLRKGPDGKWRYVVDMFSGIAAPAPAATPAKKP
jgi:ketosteroid isomerase-like protein